MFSQTPGKSPRSRRVRPLIAGAVMFVAGGVVFNMATSSANAQSGWYGDGRWYGSGDRNGGSWQGDGHHHGDGTSHQSTPSTTAKSTSTTSASGTSQRSTSTTARNGGNAGNATSTTAPRGGAAGNLPSSTTAAPAQVALANNCNRTRLGFHNGFQEGPRCVSTAFGEVSEAAKNPSLLITNSPRNVGVNQRFTITVSTRNLVRDRFLPAATGGYYIESSLLTNEGLTRGHFHTACRMLARTDSAPAPDPVPAFFKATEDGRGGSAPDSVTIEIPAGMPQAGTAQCAVWAGDGSHRVPMMQRANEIPAFDSVRIQVGQ